MKILPVGAELLPCRLTDRQTGITKTTFAFRNVANSPKNYWKYSAYVLKILVWECIQLVRRHNIEQRT